MDDDKAGKGAVLIRQYRCNLFFDFFGFSVFFLAV